MTEWTLLKRLLDAVHQHSTMMGRLWLTVMVIFRLLIVAVATEDVYADEQEMFVCNTMQPGCPTVCYDAFAPISQPRFWVFHIISVSTPSLCFIIYTWHNLSKLPHNASHQRQGQGGTTPGEGAGISALLGGAGAARDGGQEAYNRSCDSDSCSILSHKHLGHSLADVLEGLNNQSLQRGDPNTVVSLDQVPLRMCREGVGGEPARRPTVSGGVLSKCYVFHVCLRAVLEVGFVLAQWMLFGFQVPVHFLCSSAPCVQPVDCYVSRPTEKTIFLLFMYCVGVFCIVLNLLELNHLGWKKIRRAVKAREEQGGGGGGSPWASSSYPPGAMKKKKGMMGYETFPAPDSDPSSLHSSLQGGFRDVTSTASLPTLDLVVGHKPDWTCAGNCGGGDAPPLFNKEPKLRAQTTTKKQDSHRGERQPLKGKRIEGRDRPDKHRSTEVWI